MHVYEEHGDDFVEHFNGQFAIALWDAPQQRLVLARDRVGIRPLFYADAGGRFAFASEVKALLRAARRAAPPRPAGAGADASRSGRRSAPRTVFEGVHAAAAGPR